jgi:hypothetical protein
MATSPTVRRLVTLGSRAVTLLPLTGQAPLAGPQTSKFVSPSDEPCWKSITACYQGGSSWFHVYCQWSSGRPKHYLGAGSALSFPPPLLAASRSSTSGSPFEVGSVGLAPTKTHIIVSAPRSYATLKASTLRRAPGTIHDGVY